ncbi:MAG: energy transducer TonB [Candidatus Solibacter usitatus]|nr:energy transducer TonB [Candidatus Solibacter usitatus]
MFEQSFVEGKARTNRGTSVALSFILQVSVVVVAVVIPLINPDLLPRAVLAATLLSAPPLPPPPGPQAGTQAKRAAPRQWDGRDLLRPSRILQPVTEIVDAPDGPGGPEVPGSVGPGVPSGVSDALFDNLVDTAHRVAPPPPPVAKEPVRTPKPAGPIRVGGDVQEALILHRKIPDYPPLARQARVEGRVVFSAIIGTSGTIQHLQVMSGHPLLAPAAAEAVRQWRYRPTLLNGSPVEVATVIEVRFTLNR